ncbi:MAG: formylglycine-generating enzyme family protein [Burkholderiales bacterium]|nr:formylglycine-generating enzyme family protein [Anaerolineae bacterium]
MKPKLVLAIALALTFVLIYGCGKEPSPAAVTQSGAAQAVAPTSFRDCDDCPEMVVIPAGSFVMGSPASEAQRGYDEGPQHQVTIARPFAAGKFEITFAEWDACVSDRGCVRVDGAPGAPDDDEGWGRGRQPAIKIAWSETKQYVQWLSRKTGKNYRLLSEAEWEYVARAGTTTPFSTGATITPSQANYDTKHSYAGGATGQPSQRTAAVGSFKPNAFGLHDVHGNVSEWVEDCTNPGYKGAPSDGSAWTTGDCERRVLRGGGYSSYPAHLRSARRDAAFSHASLWTTSYGFRVARTD